MAFVPSRGTSWRWLTETGAGADPWSNVAVLKVSWQLKGPSVDRRRLPFQHEPKEVPDLRMRFLLLLALKYNSAEQRPGIGQTLSSLH